MLPAIRTEDSITLGAELIDGTIIRGQNQISHPSVQGGPLGCVLRPVKISARAGNKAVIRAPRLRRSGSKNPFPTRSQANTKGYHCGGGHVWCGLQHLSNTGCCGLRSHCNPPPCLCAGLQSQLSGSHEVVKDGMEQPLPAPVKRILYLSPQGTLIENKELLPPNPSVIAQIHSADAIVFGIGSLYTSICPSLILEVGLPYWRCL